MKKILFLCLLLSGCNSMDVAGAGFSGLNFASQLGVDYDTNGYQSTRTRPHQKVCEIRTGKNSWAWKPCN